MQFVADLGTLLAYRNFRRLFAVRLTSQFSDGLFQVSLASFVLFSPERQPTAGAIAAAFAVLLLPFSVLGPFCGVLIDRWSRRQVLLWSNLVRAGLLVPIAVLVATGHDGPIFYGLVLACFSVNRFLLSALSAALPHVVPGPRLVMANAVSPTCGTLIFLIGLGAGSVVEGFARRLPVHPEAVVLLTAVIAYATAGLLALRMRRTLLGPDEATAQPAITNALWFVVRGLRAGLRHVVERRPAAYGLAMIGVHRFGYGASTVASVLLMRNFFHPGNPGAALSGMALTVLISGAGYGVAALSTPVVTHRISKQAWVIVLLTCAAVVQIFPGMLFTEPAVFVAAFVLGVASQGIKICVDTLVQENIDDGYRGRVFALYDVLFNVVLVAAASVAALVLPPTGKSYALFGGLAVLYVLAALVYGRVGRPSTATRTAASGTGTGTGTPAEVEGR